MSSHRPRHTPGPRVLAWVAGTSLVVAIDQLAKAGSGHLTALPGVLPVHNPALSLELVNSGRWAEVAAMLLGAVLAACWLIPRSHTVSSVLGTTLLLGGAVGNLVDRVAFGYVRDFLAVGPVVINLADLAVLAGLLLLLVHRPNALSGHRLASAGR